MAPTRDAWLVFNGDRSVKIDRDKVANSCHFLQCLLNGSYKEANQYTIEVNLGTSFSFEAFRCIIRYANDGIFYRDTENFGMYLGAIQLGICWGFTQFVELVETHIIERFLTREDIDTLYVLAKMNRPTLERLYIACEEFAESMARSDFFPISRCAVDHHQLHAFMECVKPVEDEDYDWDETTTVVMPETNGEICHNIERGIPKHGWGRLKHKSRNYIAVEQMDEVREQNQEVSYDDHTIKVRFGPDKLGREFYVNERNLDYKQPSKPRKSSVPNYKAR